MTRYVLPDLPYDYSALEPHISGRIMELHHDKHHQAYVDGANKTLEALEQARAKNDFAQVGPLTQALSFHVSGHVLHSLFWQNLSPHGGGRPTGELAEAISRDFGSFDALKTQLNKGAAAITGSGWSVLAWEPVSARLVTTQIHDHQSHTIQASVPLLVIDAWEHAYYLQYQNEKAKFFDAVWNLWNWADVAERYTSAKAVELRTAGNGGQPGLQKDRKRADREQPAGRA